MARFKATAQGDVPFTAEEEAEWDVLEAKQEVEKAEEARLAYKSKRAKEYPPMSDYIDGIVKGDQAQVQAYIDACLAIKEKYPKPDAP